MNRLTGSFHVGLCVLALAGATSNALADLPAFGTLDSRLPTPEVPYDLVDPRADFGEGGMISVYSLHLQAADPDQVEEPIPDPNSGDWTLDSFFDVSYTMQMSIGLGPVFPVFGEGQMHVVGGAAGGLDSFTREFHLELTQLDLFPPAVGDPIVPVYVRESPTLASTGVTTTVNTCPFVCFPTPFEVTSFFDVFAEISLDGETWSPSVDSFRIVQGVPEPSTWLLAMLTMPVAWRYRHRS